MNKIHTLRALVVTASIGCIACVLSGRAILPSAMAADSAAPRPNYLIIFIDDMGYGDPGCFGGITARTPHIDKLATQGTRFTSFYAQSVCC